jgi:hypothetical protein
VYKLTAWLDKHPPLQERKEPAPNLCLQRGYGYVVDVNSKVLIWPAYVEFRQAGFSFMSVLEMHEKISSMYKVFRYLLSSFLFLISEEWK